MNTYFCLATAFDWDTGTLESGITPIKAEKKPASTWDFKDGLHPLEDGAVTFEKKFYATQANAEKALQKAVEEAKRNAEWAARHRITQRPKQQGKTKIIDITPFLRKGGV